MKDKTFLELLEKTADSPARWEQHISKINVNYMTDVQWNIVQAILIVAHIGGKNKLSGGRERIVQTFTGNFDANGNPIGNGGKQTQGALSPTSTVLKEIKMAEIHRQIKSEGLSQKKACAAAKVDPKDYRTWRNSRGK